jgi:O-antigen ligase
VLAGSVVGATLAAFAALLLAPTPWAATIYLVVGVLTGTAIVITGFGAREHGLILITFLVTLGAATIDFSPLPVYRYLLVSDLLLVSAGLIAWLTGSTMRAPFLLMACLSVYVASGLASFLRTSDPAGGMFTWIHTAFLCLVYIPLVATALGTRRQLVRYAFAGVLLSGVAQSLLLLLEVASGLDWASGPRITGALGNASLWIFAVSMLAVTTLMLKGGLFGRPIGLLAGVVILPAATITRSRSIWIGIVVGVALSMIVFPRRKLAGMVAAATFAAGLAGAYILELYPRPVQERITRTLSTDRSIDVIYRFEVVWRLYPRVAESPLVGVGLNESSKHLPAHLVRAAVPAVHNVVLHAAVESGIPAALALTALPGIVFLLWRRARLDTRDDPSIRKFADWAFIAFAASYVGVQFTPTMYEHINYFLIAILVSLLRDPRKLHLAETPEKSS